MNDQTPWIYQGRVGHDVSVGFCSCGGYHYPEDGVRAGTKTVAIDVDGEMRIVEYSQDDEGKILIAVRAE